LLLKDDFTPKIVMLIKNIRVALKFNYIDKSTGIIIKLVKSKEERWKLLV